MKINKNIILIGVLLYCLTNILLLVNHGIFWDDWTLYNNSNYNINKIFSDVGMSFIGTFHIWLLKNTNAVILYHAIAFICFLIAFYFQIKTIELINYFNKIEIAVFSIILFILPINEAKICLIDIPYSICYLLFFIACFIAVNLVRSKNTTNAYYVLLRFFSLFLFTISFITNSFLFFYIVPLLAMYAISLENNTKLLSIKNIVFFAKKNIDFVSIPILFYVFKMLFLKPTNMYSTYNEINFVGILLMPINLVHGLISLVVGFFNEIEITLISFSSIIYFTISVLLLYKLLNNKIDFKPTENNQQFKSKYLIAIFLIIAAILPYCLVGKIPTFQDFNTRHQLILFTGVSLLFAILICNIQKKSNFILANSIVITILCFMGFQHKMLFVKEWFKLTAIEKQIQLNQNKFDQSNLVLIQDNTDEIDVEDHHISGGEIRFYTWNAIYKKATGKENKFFITENEYELSKKNNQISDFIKNKSNFLMKDYTPNNSVLPLKITAGTYELTNINTLKLLKKYYSNRKEFNEIIPNVLQFDFGMDKAKIE